MQIPSGACIMRAEAQWLRLVVVHRIPGLISRMLSNRVRMIIVVRLLIALGLVRVVGTPPFQAALSHMLPFIVF